MDLNIDLFACWIITVQQPKITKNKKRKRKNNKTLKRRKRRNLLSEFSFSEFAILSIRPKSKSGKRKNRKKIPRFPTFPSFMSFRPGRNGVLYHMPGKILLMSMSHVTQCNTSYNFILLPYQLTIDVLNILVPLATIALTQDVHKAYRQVCLPIISKLGSGKQFWIILDPCKMIAP